MCLGHKKLKKLNKYSVTTTQQNCSKKILMSAKNDRNDLNNGSVCNSCIFNYDNNSISDIEA